MSEAFDIAVRPERSRWLRMGLSISAAVISLDQASKWWVVEHVMQPPRIIEVTSFFNLVMGWNRGVSFGLFSSAQPWVPWVLLAAAGLIVFALLYWLVRAESRTMATALSLIIGGAIGNVIDRLRFGAVADFLDFHVAGYHWPAFNVADSAITIGAVLLVFHSLFVRPEADRTEL